MKRPLWSGLLVLPYLLVPLEAAAAPAGAPPVLAGAPSAWSGPVMLAGLSLLPLAFIGLTAFVKISTVLQIVRSAIGAPEVPSGTILLVLSGALTLLAMAPTGEKMMERARPLVAMAATADPAHLLDEAATALGEPLRDFFERNAHPEEKARFLELARRTASPAARPSLSERAFSVAAPAFIVSELSEAFSLGFLLFLPFLVIDLVTVQVLLALGGSSLSPQQISLPLKLLFFVSVDGWGRLAQALVGSYR